MSILVSSLSMMAVFLESSMVSKSSEIPGHIVFTFQLAKRSAGDFFAVFCVFPGAWFSSAYREYTLSSKHPLKQADVGGSAPY